MKIDLTIQIEAIDGNPMTDGDAPVLLRTIIQNALLGQFQGEQNMEGSEKLRLWQLARRANADAADFSIEEMATIKDRVGRAYGPAVVGPVYEILDPS